MPGHRTGEPRPLAAREEHLEDRRAADAHEQHDERDEREPAHAARLAAASGRPGGRTLCSAPCSCSLCSRRRSRSCSPLALARRYLQRRRTSQAFWAVALAMYAVASAAVALGALDGWTSGEFRIYWALGAVLNVPFLAQGEVDLLVRNRAVRWTCYALLAFVTAYTIARVRTAPLADAERAARGSPVGQGGVRRRLRGAPAAAADLDPRVPRLGRRRDLVGVADARAAGAPRPVRRDAGDRARLDGDRRVRLGVRGARASAGRSRPRCSSGSP